MIPTRNQRVARAAYQAVEARAQGNDRGAYLSFARSFPTLIHTCGLAQASAFALAKGEEKLKVLDDVATVLGRANGAALHKEVHPDPDGSGSLFAYARLTREALHAATWVKRYAEALIDKEKKEDHEREDTRGRGTAEIA